MRALPYLDGVELGDELGQLRVHVELVRVWRLARRPSPGSHTTCMIDLSIDNLTCATALRP